MKRIKKFGVFQTAKVFAVITFLFSSFMLLPFFIYVSFLSSIFGQSFGSMGLFFPSGSSYFLIIIPFIYGILGFIMSAIGCLIYNLISKWTGGIEIEVETKD
ncbi:MAG TPA: hypothetical protein EYQ86_05325 [Bacteroidetes bacterium]|nr:hypothetical protein [Bacteroidota bacterium]